MNWDESLPWERELEMFEQLVRIANALERLAERKKGALGKIVEFTDKENEVLNGLDRLDI